MGAQPTSRLQAIDALRGTVMIIMALDHIRDFIHRGAMSFQPTDLTKTDPLLFFTRWITHYCAPVFMFTAGMGAFLWLQRNRNTSQLARFLWTRGLWLIVLELLVMRLAYYFSLSLSYPILLLVLWVLGLSMVVLAGLVYLPVRLLAVLSVAVIVLHNSLDGIDAGKLGAVGPLWNLIHQSGAFMLGGVLVVVGYPLVPWFAVMAAGFCFARIFQREPQERQRIMLRTGWAMTAAFVVLRAVNVYGDPVRWTVQKSAVFTLLSFLNCTKYPPSLLFLLMTLGPALVALAYFDRCRFSTTHPLIVFGRVPLFYFVVHFYLAHLAAIVLAWLRYGAKAVPLLTGPLPSMGGSPEAFPPDFGYSLWVVYALWAAIVIGLYPVCRWFARIKAERRDWWLSYL